MVIKIIRNKNSNRVTFDQFNVNYAQLREDAQKIDLSEIIKGGNAEDDWVAFQKEIIDIRDKYIPKKTYKVSFKAKWVTKEVTKCRRLKLKHENVMLNYKQQKHMIITKKNYESQYLNKAAHFEFEKRLSENIINNSKSFYSYVKSKQRSKDKIGPH